MRKISTARTSRRAPGLKDSDYDHEIALVDHAAQATAPQALSPDTSAHTDQTDRALASSRAGETDQTSSKDTCAASTGPAVQPGPSSPRLGRPESRSTVSASDTSTSAKSQNSRRSPKKSSGRQGSKERIDIPRVEVEGEELCRRLKEVVLCLTLSRAYTIEQTTHFERQAPQQNLTRNRHRYLV